VEHEIKILGNAEALAEMIKSYGRPGIHHSLTTVTQ
jgi:hypothetical protein